MINGDTQQPLKEELRRIYKEERDELLKLVKEIKTTVDSQALHNIGINKDIADIKKALFGNGKQGLLEEFNQFKLKIIVAYTILALGGLGSGVGFFNLLKTIIL